MSSTVITNKNVCPKTNSVPFRSPLRYPGGKQKALAQIAGFLPDKVAEYREPMVGGGSIYFHVRSKALANKYWINDQFDELIAFWQTVQSDKLCQRLITDLSKLRKRLVTAIQVKDFYLQAREKEVVDAYEMAKLFFFFNRVTFSGTTKAGGFSAAAAQSRFTMSSIERLRAMPEALAQTKVSKGDFAELIIKPGKDVFMFLDPPYFTANKLYGKNGSLHGFDHERLADLLRVSKHKFLITYDDCPQIRELYKWARIEKWQLQYGMNNCNIAKTSKIGNEIFIFNY